MNIREIISLEPNEQQLFFERFSALPAGLLDWVAKNYKEVVIVWNENERICFVSESVRQLLGFETEDMLGKYWYDFFNEEIVENMSKYINTDKQPFIFRSSIENKNEKQLPVEISIDRIKDNDMSYTISSLRDLTEYAEAQAMMIQTEKMSITGQLAAGIAHEIRNPLTSLKGFLQLLQAGVNHKEEYYMIMKDEIEKLEAITSELLFMSKPLTNIKKVESVNKMIRDVVVLLQSQAKLKNITINVEEPITDTIYCDSSQIKQVLINLVKNGIEAMDEPGQITVYVSSDESRVMIHVKDEGIGIPEDIIEQLGVPFFTTKKNGTGLGLNITKEILQQHEGYLNFSKNIKKGSTFQLVLPKILNE